MATSVLGSLVAFWGDCFSRWGRGLGYEYITWWQVSNPTESFPDGSIMGTLVHSCPNNKETSFILLQQHTVKYSGIIVSPSNFPLRSVKEENFLLNSVEVKPSFYGLRWTEGCPLYFRKRTAQAPSSKTELKLVVSEDKLCEKEIIMENDNDGYHIMGKRWQFS